ncbi:MAG: AIPR family protein [Pseudobutyrivibrio sp.]|nr:AIPR family protein [Pseudobutyrivibrio sp.]
MAKTEELRQFYEDLSQEIINKAAIDETEDYRENIFTQIYIDYLCEAAEIEDGNVCFHEGRGVKVNGYSIAEDESYFAIFVSIYKNNPDVYSVPPSEAIQMINRAKQFYLKCLKNYQVEIEEAYAAFDLARSITEYKDIIDEVKIILMTNGTIRSTVIEPEEIDGITFEPTIWDLERIYRVCTSGAAREKIEFNLKDLAGKNLQAIKIDIPEVERTEKNGESVQSGGYSSYLTAFPGDVLYKIYETYDARLLEKNVRAFLQARGGVNKGIRSTILDNPEMFLAYNNGISATAEAIKAVNKGDGIYEITDLIDFQIVNGGQTTASIFNACIKNKEPLEHIYVQAKITVLNNQSQMDKVVPQISACANTQNKVQLADFSANDEFHQAMEALSRTVWAPAKTGGEQQTKWFYERARGQYADTRSREKNVKYFDSIYPKAQYFDKLELARYENVWEQLPYITSKGGQASFRDFTIRLKKRGKFIPNQDYYQELIAKAILYRRVRQIVRAQQFQGFWANIADYTVAYLSYKSAQRIDLQKIWRQQATSEEIDRMAETVSNAIYNYLTETCAGINTTQWCKKEICWNEIKEKINIPLDNDVVKGLIPLGKEKPRGIDNPDDGENEMITAVKDVPADVWFTISSWGKETGILQGYQCGIAGTLGRYVGWHKAPSVKQARQGIKILIIANRRGLTLDDACKEIISKYASLEDD